MKEIREAMSRNFQAAASARRSLSKEITPPVEEQIRRILSLKHRMECLAREREYSAACRSSIPSCRGECCKWHFPRDLTRVDFFVALFRMSPERRAALAQMIHKGTKNHCPMLQSTGCLLSFEERPVVCTNAYPCFADRSYWLEKEEANLLFREAFGALEALVFPHPDDAGGCGPAGPRI